MMKETPRPDSSYTDIDDFMPQPTGSGGGGGSTGPRDAGAPPQLDDGGRYETPVTSMQVFCGPNTCDATQSVCCITDGVGASCSAKSGTCSGNVRLACDGPDDCGAGEHCCVEPDAVRVAMVCRPSCAAAPTQLCHSTADCNGDRPACCHNDGFPLGHCLPFNAIANGDRCDVP